MNFQRITRLSVPEEIIADIKQKITSGELLPGDRLPTEKTLAELYGVGRGTIREAVKAMIYLGILTRTSNRATFISDTAVEKVIMKKVFESFSNHHDSFEMIEVRKIIEPAAASLAAERKKKDVIERLEIEYENMLKNRDDVNAFIEYDNRFHNCIFSGTGNRMIYELMESIHNAVRKNQASVLLVSSSIKPRSLKFHKEILESIKAGDSCKAGDIMLNHILDVETEMISIYRSKKNQEKIS